MKNKAIRICAITMALYLVLGALFYPIAGDSLHFTADSTESVSAGGTLGEITAEETVSQAFQCEFDSLHSVSVKVGTMARTNTDKIRAVLRDQNGNTLFESEIDTAQMQDNSDYLILLDKPIEDARGRYFTLYLTSLMGTKGNAITFYYGNSVSSGRLETDVEIEDTEALYLNGERKTDAAGELCQLCLRTNGVNYHRFGAIYWWVYAGGALLLALLLVLLLICHKRGKNNPVLSIARSLDKYSFLVRQLVARDFKTKYKRSVLGVLWSFLNPLLTMSIQFVVFSTMFRTSIPNFMIYLLIGIICFNFFSEATNMCLMSIVGNATLINKVYVPKYIYPFSRTLSSSINLLLSLVPLTIMLFITRTPITEAALLLPFGLLMLFLFSYGMGLLLATLMVFFRDTQFLWGIFSMLLMYLTPIFYSETIIPASLMPIYKLNPLYHIIRFIRCILIDGISPEPKAYVICAALCLLPLLLGALVFRKNQNKFVLNI